MWIPLDTRLADHPRVHQIAVRCQLPHDLVVGLMARLWGLCADLDTDVLPGDLESLSQCYRLPKGFLAAVVEVGWASTGTGEVRFSVRSTSRREIAKRAADARWMHARMHGGMHDASARMHPDASASISDASAMHGLQRKRQRKKETERGGSPPPTSPDGSAASNLPSIEERQAYLAAVRATLNGAAQ